MWQQVILTALCWVMLLGAAGVAAWALASGQVWEQGIDGLFLVIVCLLIALVFAPIPLEAVRRSSLRSLLRRKKAQTVEREEPRVAPSTSREAEERSEQGG